MRYGTDVRPHPPSSKEVKGNRSGYHIGTIGGNNKRHVRHHPPQIGWLRKGFDNKARIHGKSGVQQQKASYNNQGSQKRKARGIILGLLFFRMKRNFLIFDVNTSPYWI